MKEYIAQEWKQILEGLGLADFDSLWRLDLELLDKPNTERRNGAWSMACLLSLKMPDGHENRFVIKRQQGHMSFSFRHPFRGIPTFLKEYYNIRRYRRLGIPTLDIVYYGQRKEPNGVQSMLITEYLEGYTSLSDLEIHKRDQQLNKSENKCIIEAVASHLRTLHSKGLQHNCLYSKHVFIQQRNHEIRIKLIDLENTKWRPFGNGRKIRDIESLYRRTKGWTRTDRLRFFKIYCGTEYLDKRAKKLCTQIIRRNNRKCHP